ncbi:hypothetical protein EYZ11_007451 [Aspergillus tanneri]|uniref:Uncharacterized protein n=1 Tax=Aspergillus tanneri TaxID=1220188 RepID=A0A4S3JDF9_9EURO|nr:uncharacterized protein ATNIH1004_004928 [Aspergillus tanneri]KAA8649037.1 hypothetical protein ATNIH1004_004928 [Aspergillus tanneri]THC93085.1 hypothetical protein EYZ11_007451 [Aspergillus tanneri]
MCQPYNTNNNGPASAVNSLSSHVSALNGYFLPLRLPALMRTDESHTALHPRSRAFEKEMRSATWQPTLQFESNDRSDKRRGIQTKDGRGSSLEGSTLSGSSRDADRGGRAQRRVHSSGGFLVDSSFLPKSISLRTSHHQARRSEPDQREKRGAPESDITVSKKRSRFPWSRQKETAKETPPVSIEGESSREPPAPQQHVQQDATTHALYPMPAEHRASMGLDKDSLQIVNLALNLSESRKFNTLGRSASNRLSGGRWSTSAGQATVPFAESHAPVAASGFGQDNSHVHRNLPQPFEGQSKPVGLWHEGPMANATPSVLSLLPPSAGSNYSPHTASDSTLARAENAKRHFELFTEYLRLLPSLPPLQLHDTRSTTDSNPANDDRPSSGRVYNPLQVIRNRKVRFRERCPIDPEAEGWHDVENVRDWVTSIETKYSHQDHNTSQCLRLPPFRHRALDVPQKERNEKEPWAASPPSSLKQISRTSSTKAYRPRFDWILSPAELLADAAWVEHVANKSRIVDREGNNLYPDATVLVDHDTYQHIPESEEQLPATGRPMEAEVASRTSLSDSHPGLAEFKRIGRGRRRHRFKSPSRVVHSQSISKKGSSSRRRKLGIGSSSSSSISTLDERPSWASRMDDVLQSGRSISPTYSMSIQKEPAAPHDEGSADETSVPTQGFAGAGKVEGKTGSVSSAPSRDDRYGPLASSTIVDPKVPTTPLHMGFFPGIASNLSSPSSRSPSPSKARLQRSITSRHDRSKSNTQPVAEDNSFDSEALRKYSTPGRTDAWPRPGKVESSPLPDRIPHVHHSDQTKVGVHARKGSSGQHESKLRGIFRGPGKLAEKVSNEVSKMGGLILKKDSTVHSRQSSFATSAGADEGDVSDSIEPFDKNKVTQLEDTNKDNNLGAMTPSHQAPTSSDDVSRPTRRGPENAGAEGSVRLPSRLSSPIRQGDLDEDRGVSELGRRSKDDLKSQNYGMIKSQRKDRGISTSMLHHHHPTCGPEKSFGFGPELHTIREEIRKGRIKDPSVPFSMTRPPVTGLAQAKVTPASSSQERQPISSDQSQSWSISERSIPTEVDIGLPGKREVARTRALLLSSGIKAREITRRAESVQDPPEFLQQAFEPNTPVPRVPRCHEYELAVQTLLHRVEASHNRFQRSIDNYPGEDSSALKSQLHDLENLVQNALNPRVRAAAQDAEDLSIQLNTTSTLAVKQLSDVLDKGIRKRHRRLRWLRRTGFGMLEWALVGVLWWVWLIVMAFKLLRGVLRGLVSAARWVLWL